MSSYIASNLAYMNSDNKQEQQRREQFHKARERINSPSPQPLQQQRTSQGKDDKMGPKEG